MQLFGRSRGALASSIGWARVSVRPGPESAIRDGRVLDRARQVNLPSRSRALDDGLGDVQVTVHRDVEDRVHTGGTAPTDLEASSVAVVARNSGLRGSAAEIDISKIQQRRAAMTYTKTATAEEEECASVEEQPTALPQAAVWNPLALLDLSRFPAEATSSSTEDDNNKTWS